MTKPDEGKVEVLNIPHVTGVNKPRAWCSRVALPRLCSNVGTGQEAMLRCNKAVVLCKMQLYVYIYMHIILIFGQQNERPRQSRSRWLCYFLDAARNQRLIGILKWLRKVLLVFF